ncbi:MAG: hypothetical protein RLZZ142_1112 [Verrucomicrobiota bacterium]
MKLTTKLVLAILVSGLLPALLIGRLAWRAAEESAGDSGDYYLAMAEEVASRIDRTLFERYGDVQAFASNGHIQDIKSWYLPDSSQNRVAQAANRNVALYGGFYALSFMVDTKGRVVAVNDRDSEGRLIDTKYLYQKNFADSPWFRDTLSGNFTKGPQSDGTYAQDVHVDEDVAKVFNTEGLCLGYSAQVKDAAGLVIGVWHNSANFSLVEENVVSAYKQLANRSLTETDVVVLDRYGRLLVDYDPTRDGKEEVVRRMDSLLKTNLASLGDEAAREAMQGHSGHLVTVNSQTKVEQMVGYAVCKGALGAPTFKWAVLVRTPAEHALALPILHRQMISFYLIASAAGLVVVAWLLSRAIAQSVVREVGRLQSINDSLSLASNQFSKSSETVAQGASEQAAALEETSASLEEIAAMTRRTSENANSGKSLSQSARDSADVGLEKLSEMSRTLSGIRSAVMEMESAVREMQSSSQEVANIITTIDEIAFQTNLLALNAAVEAARAGEAGMGFAVVADEVRSLAQSSAQAAKETAKKIDSSIQRSEQSGVASAKVVRSLTEVEATAEGLQAVFQGIVRQVTSLDEVIHEMAVACGEQSTGINEVNQAVTQMDSVTQGNAAVAEENAGVANELKSHVLSLKQVFVALQAVVSGRKSAEAAGGEGAQPFFHKPQLSLGKSGGGKVSVSLGREARPSLPLRSGSAAAQPAKSASASSLIPMPGERDFAKSSEAIENSFKDF